MKTHTESNAVFICIQDEKDAFNFRGEKIGIESKKQLYYKESPDIRNDVYRLSQDIGAKKKLNPYEFDSLDKASALCHLVNMMHSNSMFYPVKITKDVKKTMSIK